MTSRDYSQLVLLIAILLLTAKPLGLYFLRVFGGEKTFLHKFLGPIENFIYRIAGIRPDQDQNWVRYATDVLLFSAAAFLFTFVLIHFQHILPFNSI
jgi:potassium-transporting ATPase potassium-binding subunit